MSSTPKVRREPKRNEGECSPSGKPERHWPKVVPFDRPLVPAFPTEVLPAWTRHFVEAASVETETAPDLAALAVLSAIATACARRFQVEQRIGFLQPVNLWTLSLLMSGGRKSRVFQLATAALSTWQMRQADELNEKIAGEESVKRRLEQKLKRAEKAFADAKDHEHQKTAANEADHLARQLASFEVTRAPVLFVTEATPERLEELLGEQGERMAVLSDEAGMLGLLSGRYSHGSPNLSALLTGHDGGPIRVARKKRDNGTGGDRMLKHAVVTFGLSVQPEIVFAQLRSQRAFFDSGFAWRFLFALVPSSLGERTHRTPVVPGELINEYANNLTQLLELPVPNGLDFPVIRMTEAATEALIDWEAKVQEPQLRPGGALGNLQSWGSKVASRLCRIAALFHAAEHRAAPWAHLLELETMQRALSLAPYFTAHAKAVAFELHADPDMRLAHRALEWVLKEKHTRFSQRELQKAILNNDRVTLLSQPLRILADRGFVMSAQVPQSEPKRAGRPSVLFDVNPAAYDRAK